MRRLTWLSAAMAVALVTTGVAIGQLRHDRATSAVAGTFTATTVGPRTTATCTSGDGTFQITHGAYSGLSSGDASLTGPIRLAVRAVINTSDKLGTVDGLVIVDRSGRDTRARLTGVYDNGKVSGLLTGATVMPGQRLVGTFTAAYSSDGGFTSGGIGSGAVDPTALQTTGGVCKTESSESSPTGKLKLLGGSVSALTSASITIGLVAGNSFSCSLDDHARAEISRRHIAVGDRVAAACAFRAGVWTLHSVRKLR
jgi:hypothetical protein